MTDDNGGERELAKVTVINRKEISISQTVNYDMSPIAADAHKHRADADARIAEAQARSAEATYSVPAIQETKRENFKMGATIVGLLTIVGIAASELSGAPLAWVLGISSGTLTAAWGVREAIKAKGKKPKEIAPPES